MITTTLDPITQNDVTDLENAPFVREGEGDSALGIYFVSEANKQEYRNTEVHGSEGRSGQKNINDARADTPDTGSNN